MLLIALAAVGLEIVAAEVGLIVKSNMDSIDGLPVRLVDGRLTVNGDGPIFQGIYDDGSLVLSQRVVSEDAIGSGVGLTDDGLLIVTFNSSTTFYDRDGWLEYNGQGLFGLKQNDRSYDIYTDRPDLENANPVLLQLAALIYPNDTQSLSE